MRCQHLLTAAALLLVASILQCGGQSTGRPARSPRPPSLPPPPPLPPFPTAQLIRLTAGSNQCVDIAGGRVINGAKLVQARCNVSSPTQKFITLNTGSVLRFISAANSTRCWSAWPLYDNAPPASGDYEPDMSYNGAVRIWTCDFADDGQEFKPVAQPTGWSLVPAFSRINCVTMTPTRNETLLQLSACSGVASQTFLFDGLSPPPAAGVAPPPSPTASPVTSPPSPVAFSPPPVDSSPPPKSPPPSKLPPNPPPAKKGRSPPPSPPPTTSSPPPTTSSPPPKATSPPPKAPPPKTPPPNTPPPKATPPPPPRSAPPPRTRSPRL